ncbi:MAG: laccase [Nitriliruptorales bacterium]|nr:laccase [Nitriliruptorales bacterium]
MTSAARAATLRPSNASTPVTVAIPEDPAVRIVFTGRSLGADGDANLSLIVGDGDAVVARQAALKLLGVSLERAVFMQQVHGGDVAAVDVADAGRGGLVHADAVPGVDALVTSARDLALAVLVADCVPVVLVDPGRAVGVAHAGRGGVVHDVVPAAAARLSDDVSRVVAVIGPAIGACCYEVPGELSDEVAATNPAATATTSWGTPSLDLPGAVRAQLRAAGVARVEDAGGCTRCHAGMLFSHRAATEGIAPHGRQAGMVVRRSPDAAPPGGGLRSSLELA